MYLIILKKKFNILPTNRTYLIWCRLFFLHINIQLQTLIFKREISGSSITLVLKNNPKIHNVSKFYLLHLLLSNATIKVTC